MKSTRSVVASCCAVGRTAAVLALALILLSRSALASTPTHIDVSQRAGNESAEAIAVNPTNPNNIVVFTNIAEGTAGMFLAVSFDGGNTWSRRVVGEGNDGFGDTCCDRRLGFL